ncbi:Polyketide synthase PksN [Streptomyces alboniger]
MGQTDYAYANSFLAHYLERRPGGGLTVDWSVGRDGGMTLTAEAREAMRREFGMEPLPSEAALDALEAALRGGASRVLLTARRPRAGVREALRRTAGPPSRRPRPRHASADAAATCGAAHGHVSAGTCSPTELKTALEDVAEDEAFDHYGVDSLLVLSLTRALEDVPGRSPRRCSSST